MQTDPFDTLAKHKASKQQGNRTLDEAAQHWARPIRAGLQRLAQTTWPNGHILAVIPARRYRLRQKITPKGYVWWVEHDIPPYDRYWCAAYRVQLGLDGGNRPTLTVQSGTMVHPVWPLNQENLNQALAQAGDDLPLLLPRHMGRVIDP